MFRSLSVKNFRLYWVGMLVSLVGTWVQSVAQSWLVFQLTQSAFLLGLVGFLGSIPVFFLSLFAGVIADRAPKKSILIITQSVFMLLAFSLAALTQLKLVTPQQIMFIAFLNGVVMAFDAPCRQAVVVELVGKKHLLNAIALNSAAFNSARILGPALAGILVAGIGMSGCFYLNGFSFLAVLLALFLIKIEKQPKQNPDHFFKELTAGLKFIRGNRTILGLISIVAVSSFFGISYVILMPVFANDILKVGVKGLGMLMSSSGIGALVAALSLARLGDIAFKGKLLFFSNLIFALGLIVFSFSNSFLLSLAALFFVGWASVSAMSLINTLLQTLVPDNFRGRVMSVFMFTFAGMMPFGNLLAGGLAQVWGVRMAVFFGAVVCGVFFLAISLFNQEIRRL